MESAAPRHLRLVTLNVSDLFGEGKLTPKGKQPKPADELDGVAATLREADGDVVALQEVQAREVLDASLMPRLGEGAYPYRAVLSTDPRGIHNTAILSKYPIANPEALPGVTIPTGPTRGVGAAEVQVPGYPFRFYDVHFKADPYYAKPSTPEQQQAARDARMSEAHAVKDRLAAFPSQHYAVAGDMNATPDRPEIGYLLHGEGPKLQDPLEGRTGPETWSHPVTEGRYDYILVDGDAKVTGARVLKGSGTDHGAVVVDLELPGH